MPGNRERQLKGRESLPRVEQTICGTAGSSWIMAGSRLCRGELSRGTKPCLSSAVERGVAGPPACHRCHRRLGSGGDRSNTTAPGSARGARLVLLHLVPPPLFACISFPGAPCPFFIVLLCFYSDVNFSMQLVLCLVLFV